MLRMTWDASPRGSILSPHSVRRIRRSRIVKSCLRWCPAEHGDDNGTGWFRIPSFRSLKFVRSAVHAIRIALRVCGAMAWDRTVGPMAGRVWRAGFRASREIGTSMGNSESGRDGMPAGFEAAQDGWCAGATAPLAAEAFR